MVERMVEIDIWAAHFGATHLPSVSIRAACTRSSLALSRSSLRTMSVMWSISQRLAICATTCIRVYMYTYTYTYIHVHIFICMYAYIYLYAYIYICMCVCVCVRVCVYVHVFIYTFIHTCIYVCIRWLLECTHTS